MLPAGKAILHPASILFYVHSQIFLIIMQFCPIYRVEKKSQESRKVRIQSRIRFYKETINSLLVKSSTQAC